MIDNQQRSQAEPITEEQPELASAALLRAAHEASRVDLGLQKLVCPVCARHTVTPSKRCTTPGC